MPFPRSAALRALTILSIVVPTGLSAQTYQVYFGDLHQHSTYSFDRQSGSLLPAAAYAYAKNRAGIDFMAITDHTTDLPEADYQATRAASRLYDTPDSQFVAIAGQELGSLGRTGYGHMNIFEPPARADNSTDDDTRRNLPRAYQYLIDNDLYGQFNHPGPDNDDDNFNNLAYFPDVDVHMGTMELVNGRRSASYEQQYLQALANGWHIGATGDQDNHAGNYGDRISNSGDIYLTGALAASLTKADILDAIGNQRTYAMMVSPATDRIHLTEFTADGRWMGEVFDNDDNRVDFRVAANAQTAFATASIYRNGLLVAYTEPGSNSFVWTPSDTAATGEAWYFVKLVQEDGDFAWSSPIWIKSAGADPSTDPVVTSVSTLRENLQNGLPRRLGWINVKVRGTVSVAGEFGFNGPGYLQDETGGIAVFGSLFAQQTLTNPAFEYEVTGTLATFNGLTELIPYRVSRAGVGTSPQPVRVSASDIATGGEQYEGLLVTVMNASIAGNFPAQGQDANITLNDDSGSCSLRIDKDTDIDGTTAPGGVVNVTGVVGQFDTTPPYTSGYQLLPRRQSDIAITTSITDEETAGIPTEYVLEQNYPNPFNAGTFIEYAVPEATTLALTIHDARGRRIATLVDGKTAAGRHRAYWSGRQDDGSEAASGVYFFRLYSPVITLYGKMVLLQ